MAYQLVVGKSQIFANDTAILATTEDEMEELLGRIEATSTQVGLKLNREKCCLMIIDRAGILLQQFIRIRDKGIEKKDEVIYLGAKITNNGKQEGEIRRRLAMAKSALTRLSRIWKDDNVTEKTKNDCWGVGFPDCYIWIRAMDTQSRGP